MSPALVFMLLICVLSFLRSRDTEASVKRMESSVKEDQAMLKKLKEEEAKHSAAIDKDQDALSSAHDVIEESRNNHELKNKEASDSSFKNSVESRALNDAAQLMACFYNFF